MAVEEGLNPAHVWEHSQVPDDRACIDALPVFKHLAVFL